jgi:molybdate transport system ATP-binding protein
VSLDAHVGLEVGHFHLDVDLEVLDGQVVAVLGPNGAGKTTLLRALAGLAPLTAGRIDLDGRTLDRPDTHTLVPPERRPVAVVFQDYLLFPNLTILANVAFGLRSRGRGKAEAKRIALDWLGRMGLADRAGDRPRQLSGGQAQRVALARALATDPRLLLLDEPLAALDVATRATVRQELRRHLREFTGSCLLVTHDPLDAAVIADTMVIIEDGAVVQRGTLAEITVQPRSAYVAQLLGINLLRASSQGTELQLGGGVTLTSASSESGPVFAVIPPPAIALFTADPGGSPRNTWSTEVTELHLIGDRVRVRLGDPIPLSAEVTPAALAEMDVSEGSEVWVAVKATQIVVYPDPSGPDHAERSSGT